MPEETFETPQPVQPVAEPKPRNWPKIISVAVLGVGLLVGAAYAGYWYGTESANLKTQGGEELTPSPTADPTANWKTYRDEERGFEFMYPAYAEVWFMKDMTATVRVKDSSKRLEFGELSDGNVVSIGARQLEEDRAIEEHIISEIEKVVTNPNFSLTKKKEVVVVNRLNGYTFTFTSDKFGSSQKIYLINPFSESEFAEISCDYPSPSQQGCIQLATQILSTFEFLE